MYDQVNERYTREQKVSEHEEEVTGWKIIQGKFSRVNFFQGTVISHVYVTRMVYIKRAGVHAC